MTCQAQACMMSGDVMVEWLVRARCLQASMLLDVSH